MSRKPTPGGATAIARELWQTKGRRSALAIRDALSAELRKERLNRIYPAGALIAIRSGTARVVMRGEQLPARNGNGAASAVTNHQQ